MEEESFEVRVRFAPEAAGAGTSVAKCMTTVPSRCLSGRITKRSVFPGCWALLTGPRCGPGLAAQGDQKNGLCHGPSVLHAAQTGRHGRKRRLACRSLLPAAAGVAHDAGPVCILTGCSSIRYFVLAHPVRIHAGSSQSVLYFAPAPEGLLGYPCSALP